MGSYSRRVQVCVTYFRIYINAMEARRASLAGGRARHVDLDDRAPDHRVGSPEVHPELVRVAGGVRCFKEGDVVDVAGPGGFALHPRLALRTPQRLRRAGDDVGRIRAVDDHPGRLIPGRGLDTYIIVHNIGLQAPTRNPMSMTACMATKQSPSNSA